MAKRKNLVVYMYLLALTLIMISISASNPAFVSGEEDCDELDWSISAAEEAEIVDIVSCSGHGRAFIDSLDFIKGNNKLYIWTYL
ncbi:hypothetical protein S83_017736 [Arachis hypogaea]